MNLSTRHWSKEAFQELEGAVTLYAGLRVTVAHHEAAGPVGPVEPFYLIRRLVLAD
ncbi:MULTISPECIES: hypothetical protein [Acidithiobacillus]|uniref:hypothetical protein n=1 Tax=Acidithiobacillus TaxID=119977 RepID=UPI0004AE4BB0|nr:MULTISPECIES: hypothetical protein [Acidithiobacillus]